MDKEFWSVKQCIAPSDITEGDLVAYLDGEASPQVTRHITLCPACSKEVKSLKGVDLLLSQALQQSDQIVAGQPTTTQPKIKRKALAPTSNWLRWPLGRSVQLAFTTAIIVLLFSGVAAIFLLDQSQEVNLAPVEPSQIQTAEPISHEATTKPRPEIITEAAIPDIDQNLIAETTTDYISTNSSLVQALSDIVRETVTPDFDRQRIIELGLAEIEPTAFGISEKRGEIAPPLALRQMFEKEFQNRNGHLIGHFANYPGKSHVIGPEGREYLVWADNQNGVNTLYFAYSVDEGQSWSADIKIDDRVGKVIHPKLAIDAEHNLYVVWRNWYNIDNNMFYFAYSTDDGQTWSSVVRIDGTINDTVHPNLAVDSNNGYLFVTWQNRHSANTGIYFTQSIDGGETWTDTIRVANLGS